MPKTDGAQDVRIKHADNLGSSIVLEFSDGHLAQFSAVFLRENLNSDHNRPLSDDDAEPA